MALKLLMVFLRGQKGQRGCSILEIHRALYAGSHGEHLAEGDLDHLVLDEVGLAVGLGYLQENDVVEALQQRPASMDVIITGPSIPSPVMEMADQVTELRRGF